MGAYRGESADSLREAELPAYDRCIPISRSEVIAALAESPWYAQPAPASISEHLHQAELRARRLGGASPCEPQGALLCTINSCM